MLEILLIFGLSKRIAAIAKDKGRGATGWVLLFILFWVGGELCGGILGGILSFVADNAAEEPNLLLVYGCAIAGAAVGAISAFVIVKSLSSVKEEDEYWRAPDADDYDEKFGPRKARRREDTDAYRAKDRAPGQPSDEGNYRRKPDEA